MEEAFCELRPYGILGSTLALGEGQRTLGWPAAAPTAWAPKGRLSALQTIHAPLVTSGTSGADVICGLGGNDTVYGAGGQDVIKGGSGKDTLKGEGGGDQVIGNGGSDILCGGSGDDTINSRDSVSGNDSLSGGTHDAGDKKITDETEMSVVGFP